MVRQWWSSLCNCLIRQLCGTRTGTRTDTMPKYRSHLSSHISCSVKAKHKIVQPIFSWSRSRSSSVRLNHKLWRWSNCWLWLIQTELKQDRDWDRECIGSHISCSVNVKHKIVPFFSWSRSRSRSSSVWMSHYTLFVNGEAGKGIPKCARTCCDYLMPETGCCIFRNCLLNDAWMYSM